VLNASQTNKDFGTITHPEVSQDVDVERLLDHLVRNFQQTLSRDDASVVDQDGDLNH
jgi:hypothetical protein